MLRPIDLLRYLPAGVRAQPIDSFMVMLALPAGTAGLFGPASSKSLETLLPFYAVKLWAIMLILGSLAWLCGISGVQLVGDVMILTRISCFRLGLHLLSGSSLVYASSILFVGGWNGVLAAWPLLGFSLATFLKAVDLERLRRQYSVHAAAVEKEKEKEQE